MDKYSKQMENKLYREVSVTDRLPQVETIVQTIHPDTYTNIIHAMVLDKKGNWFFYPSDIHGCEPMSWLEEVELPTEEEVKNHFPLISAYRTYSTTLAVGQRMGANWLISALKGVSDE